MVRVAFVLLFVLGCGDDVPSLPDAPPEPPGPGPARLQVDLAAQDFGSVLVETASPTATLTVTNAGESASGVPSADLAGAAASELEIVTNGCVAIVAPGGSCQIDVRFHPTTRGAKTATLVVAAEPGGSTTTLLEGVGLAPGALAIAADVTSLPAVVVGASGAEVATFTVTNTGDASTGALAVQPAGSDPSELVLSPDTCAGRQLDGGESCTITTHWRPTSAGSKSADLVVHASPGGVVVGTLRGRGLRPAALVAEPAHVALGSSVVGQPTTTTTVTLTNTGEVPSGALAYTTTDPSTIATGCAGPLAAGASCELAVTVTPPTTGVVSERIEVGDAVWIPVTALGVAAGGLVVEPTVRTYARTSVGATSTAQTFVFTNTGNVSTGLLSTEPHGGGAPRFTITADTCHDAVLAPGGQCSVSVAFAPDAGGYHDASIVLSGAPGGAVVANVRGTGAAPAALAIEPAARDFGSTAVGSHSATRQVVVTNVGGEAATVHSVALGVSGLPQFELVGSTCTAALEPGASCTVDVRYVANALGDATSTLTVTTTAGPTASVTLAAHGIAADGVQAVPGSLVFPPSLVAEPGVPQTFTIRNDGATATGVIDIVVTGTNALDFAVSHDCTTLTHGAVCKATVTFTPAWVLRRSATLEVRVGGIAVATVAVTGKGRPRLEVVGQVFEDETRYVRRDFGVGVVGSTVPPEASVILRNHTSSAHTLTITPDGSSPSRYTVADVSCGEAMPAAGLCAVRVQFTPPFDEGSTGGWFRFDIGPNVTDQAADLFSGFAVGPLRIDALDGSDFGDVPRSTVSSPRRLRVRSRAFSSPTTPMSAFVYAPFAISTDSCSGLSLIGGGTCALQVTFAPTATGPASSGVWLDWPWGTRLEPTLTGTGL